MIVRSIDGANDWLFGKGKSDYVSANNAISQNIKTRLQSFLGDCFFAADAGIDWFNLMGSKNQLAVELAVRACLLNTEGVVAIITTNIIFDSTTREIFMQYSVDTVYTRANLTTPLVGGFVFLTTEDGDILATEDGDAIGIG